jgi:hypothetical protein
MKYICIDAVFYADSNYENRLKIGWILFEILILEISHKS